MKPSKILFATVPFDGHFNPLTELAVHLKSKGHDVRWYTGKSFEHKLNKLGIPHYPFEKAAEVTQFNIDSIFPERKQLKTGIRKLNFDLKHLFIFRAPENVEDIQRIHQTFQFDVLVADTAFAAGPIIKHTLKASLVCIGIVPLMQTSVDLAPYGFGLAPQTSFLGRIKQKLMRSLAHHIVFRDVSAAYNAIIQSHGMPPYRDMLFDVPVKHTDLYLQSGIPGFEYKRQDLGHRVRFVGAMRSYRSPDKKPAEIGWLDRLQGKKVLLVSQGTMENDLSKLIIPTLEAFKNSEYLILVATGCNDTESLRSKYPQKNIIIEDMMDFYVIMPKADVYITNGGYGGTLMSIEHGLPMVSAGINEGKNEICTRIGYFRIGIDLGTECPESHAIKTAVELVLGTPLYKDAVNRLKEELMDFNTMELCERYIDEMMFDR